MRQILNKTHFFPSQSKVIELIDLAANDNTKPVQLSCDRQEFLNQDFNLMTSAQSETFAVRIASQFANFLLPSQKVDYQAALKKPLQFLIICLIAILALLALPPMADWLIGAAPDFGLFSSFTGQWSLWDRWLSFLIFFFELLFALFIGGSIFGQWVASASREALETAQRKFEMATARNVEQAESAW